MKVTSPFVRRTPLAAFHRAVQAKMETSCGWRVAVDCGSPSRENDALAAGAVLIDWSNIGKVEIRGKGALDQVAAHEPRVRQLEPLKGLSQPELTTLRLADDEFLLLTSAGNETEMMGRLRDEDCVITDLSGAAGALLLAGPTRFEVVERSAAMDLSAEGFAVGGALQTSVHMARNTVLRSVDYDLYIQQRDLTEHVHGAFLDVGQKVGLVAAGLGTLGPGWA